MLKKIIKYMLVSLSKISVNVDNYYNKWGIIGTNSTGLLFINFLNQRIFRINSEAEFSINFTSRIIGFKNIKLHKDFNTIRSFIISGGYYIQATNGITLGKNLLFGPGIKIISSNHNPKNLKENIEGKGINIGDNVWLGANVIILPGVSIGNNCIIGAGSVVTKSFGNNYIIAGNPAKIIKDNFL